MPFEQTICSCTASFAVEAAFETRQSKSASFPVLVVWFWLTWSSSLLLWRSVLVAALLRGLLHSNTFCITSANSLRDTGRVAPGSLLPSFATHLNHLSKIPITTLFRYLSASCISPELEACCSQSHGPNFRRRILGLCCCSAHSLIWRLKCSCSVQSIQTVVGLQQVEGAI